MDVVLGVCDHYFFTPYIYPSDWSEEYWLRQWISLLLVANTGALSLYLSISCFSYVFLFDKRLMEHPLFMKNQILDEIMLSFWSLPCISLPTCTIFLLEVRGHSKLYDDTTTFKYGMFGALLDFVPLILFTDACIYWIHRLMHHKLVYKYVHKKHHMYKVATPFASYAFHPLDGFMQSIPYHIYAFAFPLHKYIYLFMYGFVMIWTIIIHDGDYRVPEPLKPIINGSAHHTDHHLYFNYNYGQFFTLWDRIGGSYRTPSTYVGDGPVDQMERMRPKEHNGKEKGADDMEKVRSKQQYGKQNGTGIADMEYECTEQQYIRKQNGFTDMKKMRSKYTDSKKGGIDQEKQTNGCHRFNDALSKVSQNGLHARKPRVRVTTNNDDNVCENTERRPSVRKKVLLETERLR